MARSVTFGRDVPAPVQPQPIPPSPAAVITPATPPNSKPPGFSMIIARSDPELDAYWDSHRVRDQYYPRSLDINTDTDTVAFFGWDFVTKNGTQYCYWLCYHIAFMNEFHVGGYARQWYARTSATITYPQISSLVHDRVEDVFTAAEMAQCGPDFLQHVLMYWQMNFLQWDNDNAAQLRERTQPQAIFQHQQAATPPDIPTIQKPSSVMSNNEQSIINSPPEQPRPVSKESRRSASDQMSGEQPSHVESGTTTQTMKYSSVTLPARRFPAPPPPKSFGRLQIQEAFATQRSRGTFHHQTNLPTQERKGRGPSESLSYHPSNKPNRFAVNEPSIPRHLQDRPLLPQFSHVSPLLGGPDPRKGRDFGGGPPDMSRGPGLFVPIQGHFSGPNNNGNIPPGAYQHFTPFDPRTLVPPHVRANLPPEMLLYQPGSSPEFTLGRTGLEATPQALQHAPHHGFPSQAPAFPNHPLTIPNQFPAFTNHALSLPDQSQASYPSGRGNRSKSRGRGSFSGLNGRQGSINHRNGFQGNVQRYGTKEPARNLSGNESMTAPQRKENKFEQDRQKAIDEVSRTEKFPAYHDSGYVVHDQLLPGEKCSQKSIGPDVEEMTTLWVGSIAPGTTAVELKNFIQAKVPVKSLTHITWPHEKLGNGWTFTDFHSTSDARKALELIDKNIFCGVSLDLQVPERFRSDSEGAQKFVERKNSGPRNVGRHNSAGRHNSFRKDRGSSSFGNNSGRKNSVFSPQDARSDLPGLPAESLQKPRDVNNSPEMGHGTTNDGTHGEISKDNALKDDVSKDGAKDDLKKPKSKRKKTKSDSSPATSVDNDASTVFTPLQFKPDSSSIVSDEHPSFAQTKSPSSNTGSAIHASIIASDAILQKVSPESAPVISLTKQGQLVFEFELDEPEKGDAIGTAITGDSRVAADSLGPRLAARSNLSEAPFEDTTARVGGKATLKKKAAKARAKATEERHAEMTSIFQAAASFDMPQGGEVAPGNEGEDLKTEAKAKLEPTKDSMDAAEGLSDKIEDAPKLNCDTVVGGLIDHVEAVTTVTHIFELVQSSKDKASGLPATESEPRGSRKRSVVVSASIHPFARQLPPKQLKDQGLKMEKKQKKQKKQSSVAKAAAETDYDISIHASQDKDNASPSITFTAEGLAYWDSPTLDSVQPPRKKENCHDPRIPLTLSSGSSQLEITPGEYSGQILKEFKLADVSNSPDMTKARSSRIASQPPHVRVALPLPLHKRTVSSMMKVDRGTPFSDTDSASDVSSPMTTPKTAKEFQSPAPSPVPPFSSSPAEASSSSMITTAAVGLDIPLRREFPNPIDTHGQNQTLSDNELSTDTQPLVEARTDTGLSIITSDQGKKEKKKKPKKPRRKKVSIDNTSVDAIVVDVDLTTHAAGTSEESIAQPQGSGFHSDHPIGTGKCYEACASKDFGFVAEQEKAFEKASSCLARKENSPTKLLPPSYAQIAAPKEVGLSARSPNLPDSRQP